MFKKHRKALYKQVEVNKGRIVGISDADLNDLEKEELLAMSYAGRESFMQFPIPPHVPYNMRTTVIPPQCLRGHRRAPGESYVDIVRKVEPVAYWFSHTPEQRQENCDLMKMYMMWPVFMHASNNTTTYLRTKDPMSHEMTNKELTFIDLLEDLAELFKKVAERRSLVECSFKIGWKMEKAKYKQKICYIGDAMLWIEAAGDDDLYKTLQLQDSIRAQVLQTFFTDYAFFFIKMAEEHRILSEEVKMQKCQVCEQEYELHKAIGKQEFANENFIKAENAYTNAIYFSPENHILFSNRALCYIRLQKYRKALMDGKKAIILKNTWPKGHYRFCEALFSLGEMELAIAANEKAQKLCKNSAEGIRDLVQQHSKFETLMKEAAAVAEANAKKTKKKSTNDKSASQDDSPLENRGNQNTPVEETLQKETSNATNVGSEDGSESTSVPQQKKGKSKGKSCESSEKIKSTGTKNDSKEAQRILSPTYAQMDVASVTNMVSSLVREAYDALSDKRCHNAEGIFSRVLEILSQYDVQSLRLTKMDHVVLLYGHANALLGIRKSMELERAENRFKEIIHHHSKERFNCLAFFGIGNVYLKQNRFSDALVQYVKSKTMLTHKMVPGVLTWPTTSIVLEETRPENLEVLLNNCIEECKFPPKPDAMCRFQNCLSLPKIQIYFTDPDFKGFIRMVCCQCCIVEYHVCCWKKLKTTLHSDKHDKDFLRFSCLTPDCRGVISHIVIYDSTGEVKCEFEDKMLRKKEPHKPAVKNKGTSIKKQKVKHENKSERKKTIEEEPVDQQHSRIKVKRQEKVLPDPVVINGYHIPRDPLLLQVMQKQHLIIKGCPMSFPGFWESITAWRVISIQELNEFEKNISPPSQSDSKMKNLLNHLYKQNDRIKTRVLLYLLKVNNEHISSDLHKWIIMVDEKGLHAAEEFRNHNGEHLRSIKAQDVINLWNKSYGNIINHEIEDTHSNSLYDTLSSMNSNDFRCFLWFLEGNRDVESVASLGKELDKYFQEMDVPCDKVPAYSLEDLSNKGLKVKPKHRKKKQNQPKPIYKLSGAVSTRSQEDDIFTEENTLSLLDPYEPFTVPEFLRRDIDDFQNIYDPDMFENRYLMMVDDSMDPVRETLYEYFAQILEEHGPLSLDDEILVGEYKNFPEETQRMVEVSGGLKDFLLESYWFAMEGDLVALTGYDIPSLEESGERPQLNPTAREFRPSSYRLDISDNIDLYSDLDQRQPKPLNPSTADTRQPLSLYSGLNLSYTEKSNICDNLDQQNLYTIDNPNSDTDQEFGDDTDEASIISSNDSGPSSEDQNITRSENEPSSQENPPAGQLASNKTLNCENEPRTKRTAIVSVQVNTEMSHCAVNTDAFKPFESRQGDILQMEKEQVALKDQLKEATEKYASLKSRFQEEIASLEGQIKDTVEKNKITKKELTWLQQEYENESKKWHQEKKENQEKIKALKNNIKSTIDASDSCSRSIEEKKKQYENYIKDFAKIHYSKFDKEKAALEENIKKCEEQWEETKQRSIAAEVIVFENRKQCELLKMRIRAATIDRNIKMFNPVVLSNPAAPIAPQLREMKLAQLKLNKEMEILQVQFDEKINSVKRGLKLNNIPETPVVRVQSPLSPSELPLQPPPGLTRAPSSAIPANTAKSVEKETVASKKGQAKEAKKPPASNAKRKNPILVPLSTQRPTSLEGAAHSHPDPALASSAKPTLFDKIILELHDIFPDYKSAELTNFIKDFRSRNNGTLSGLTHEDIISRVTEHILDYQSKNMSAAAAIFKAGPAMPQPVSPQPKQPWKVVNTGAKNKWQKPNDLESCNEDPCIICHDELKQFPMHRLDCGHCFHKECIRTWLNTQSTCPTCREHALLPDDFPALPLPPSGRMRTV